MPGRPPKMRVVARRQAASAPSSSASSAWSASACLRTKFRSGGSSSAATERHRVVEQVDQVREGVAEEARDADRDVDPRPAELLERDQLEAGDPPRLRVPDGPHAEQGEDLAGVVARRPHRRRAPDDDADASPGTSPRGASSASASRVPVLVREVAGQRARVDGVDVAAGRQHVEPPARRRARGARGDVAAVRARRPAPGSRRAVREQLRHDLAPGEPSSATTSSSSAPSVRADGARRPGSQPARLEGAEQRVLRRPPPGRRGRPPSRRVPGSARAGPAARRRPARRRRRPAAPPRRARSAAASAPPQARQPQRRRRAGRAAARPRARGRGRAGRRGPGGP